MIVPKISIAMATYNGEKYLPQLLDSLLAQTLLPSEIVVVDDCSYDGTLSILETYSKKLPIKVYVNDENLGVNQNFEKAVSLTTGDYVLLCDQDDVWLPFNVESKVQALAIMPQDKPAFVASRSIMVDSNLKKILSFGVSKNTSDALEIFMTPFQGTTLAFNRTFLDVSQGWPKSFKDFPYDVFLRFCAVLTANLYALSKPLMLYRCHENNVELKMNTDRKLHILKRKWLTLLLQFNLNELRLKRLIFVMEKINKEYVIAERLQVFESLKSCFIGHKISWFKFLFLQSVSYRMKIKIILSTIISLIRKKVSISKKVVEE